MEKKTFTIKEEKTSNLKKYYTSAKDIKNSILPSSERKKIVEKYESKGFTF